LRTGYARAWTGPVIMEEEEEGRSPKTDPKIFSCRRNSGRS